MINRVLSGTLSAATLVNCVLHHLPGSVVFGLFLGFGGCLSLIWFPDDVNDLTMGSWTKGAQIDVPTPPLMIAGFGWLVLLAISIVVNVALYHAKH